MLSVLLQTLFLSTAGLLSVGSITLVILLLLSDQGWQNGLGYALGYTSAYTFIGVTVVLVGYRTAEINPDKNGLLESIPLILLGSLLVWLAYRNWRKPIAEKKTEPRFFSIVNKITPLKAFGFGMVVSVINFKNLALFLTAISVVTLSDLLITEKIIITLLSVLIFCLSVLIPVLIYILIPNHAKDLLNAFKNFLNLHSRTIGIWVPIFLGLLLLLKGITNLL